MKSRLRNIVQINDNLASRSFALFIQGMILMAVISFSISTLPELTARTRRLLEHLEVLCIAVFTVEYALRIYVAEQRRKFIFSFFGIIDVIVLVPFYFSLGMDMRALRALRFLRLFMIFKLGRYNQAIAHLTAALKIAREKILFFLVVIGIVLYLSAVGIYYFEREAQPHHFSSVFESMWWAIITLTTVGYGDIYPITVGGRVFTFFILIIGIGIIAFPTGIIAAALTAALERREEGAPGADRGAENKAAKGSSPPPDQGKK